MTKEMTCRKRKQRRGQLAVGVRKVACSRALTQPPNTTATQIAHPLMVCVRRWTDSSSGKIWKKMARDVTSE